jgi:hypothetical protein
MSLEVTAVLFKSIDCAAVALELEIPRARGFAKVFSEFVFSQKLLSTAAAER